MNFGEWFQWILFGGVGVLVVYENYQDRNSLKGSWWPRDEDE